MPDRDFSEYEGGGVLPNTLFPMGADALTASDKLRLQSIAGVEDDPLAPPDPFHWFGGVTPDPVEVQQENRQIARRDSVLRAQERNRYRGQ